MTIGRPEIILPGLFGVYSAADRLRGTFDFHNEALLAKAVPIDAIFVGDSITEMWGLDAFFQGTGGLILNRGISADRTPFVRRRYEADALQMRPQLVVLKIGVNNTGDLDNTWDPALMRTPQELEEEIVADIDAMAAATCAAGIRLALCSILPTAIPFKSNNRERNELIVRVNARLRDVASRHEAIYVDYHPHMAASDGVTLRPDVADDGLHPHLVGYEIMTDVLTETLVAADVDVLRKRE